VADGGALSPSPSLRDEEDKAPDLRPEPRPLKAQASPRAAQRGNFVTMSDKLVYVLNGPNLNRLGKREPAIYGTQTLDDIGEMIAERGRTLGLVTKMLQSNHEGALVDWLHEAEDVGAHAVLLNAGAYTHTSVALLDAIRSIKVPVIEVHLSNPHTRETFRHTSWVGMGAKATVAGFGAASYLVALEGVAGL
jgi:3-dehydroquinate dehydratase-2